MPVLGGAVWAALLMAAVALGPWAVAVVMTPVAAVASVSVVRRVLSSRKGRRAIPRLTLAAGGIGAASPVAAVGGPVPAVVVLVAGAVVLLPLLPAAAPWSVRWRIVFAGVAPGLAGSMMVLARGQKASEGLALAAAVLAYDAGAFVMGNARTALGGPVGVAAGILSVAVVAVFVAAVANPPFSGARPWVLFGILAALAPAGVVLCDRAARRVGVPALRRLDSLLLAAPAWAISVALLLPR